MSNENKHYDSTNSGAEWATPKWVWEPLGEALGGFDVDPASGAEPEPIATEQFDVDVDGLETRWYGDVWINPPYGRTQNPEWGERVLEQSRSVDVDSITALVPASTDTSWFQDYYAEADYLTFINGRISFIGAGDKNASFGSVIASFGSFPGEYVDALKAHGFVVETLGDEQ